MRVAVLCEFSGIVRDAFIAAGHDAVSCDLLPTERPGPHIMGDCRDHDWRGYDLVIAHPPCTHLAVSGARWFAAKRAEQQDALAFVRWLMRLPVAHCAIENPVSIISTQIRPADQTVHPWWFGCPEAKSTCLWLYNLPPLRPTRIVTPTMHSVHMHPPSPDRWRNRSRTFPGIAEAMASQWGSAPKQLVMIG